MGSRPGYTLHIPTNKRLEFGHNKGFLKFPWWLLLFSQEQFQAKGDFSRIQKSGKNREKSQVWPLISVG